MQWLTHSQMSWIWHQLSFHPHPLESTYKNIVGGLGPNCVLLQIQHNSLPDCILSVYYYEYLHNYCTGCVCSAYSKFKLAQTSKASFWSNNAWTLISSTCFFKKNCCYSPGRQWDHTFQMDERHGLILLPLATRITQPSKRRYGWGSCHKISAQSRFKTCSHLQFHDISTCWCPYQSSSNILGFLVQRPNVSGVLIVVYHLKQSTAALKYHLLSSTG